MSRQGPIRKFEVIVTDMISPSAETPAGTTMRANMEELRRLKCTAQLLPHQNVSALSIPEQLKMEGKVFLVGSPANHDPYGQRLAGQHGGNISFKQDVFFSMCWNTPQDTAVAMTYSRSACTFKQMGADKGLEWWSVLQRYPARTFMVAPAWFRSYRPSQGLAESNEELALNPESPDTMVAIFATAAMMAKLQWRREALDMAATVLNWLDQSGTLVTFGAFTAELELDIARTANLSSPM